MTETKLKWPETEAGKKFIAIQKAREEELKEIAAWNERYMDRFIRPYCTRSLYTRIYSFFHRIYWWVLHVNQKKVKNG